MFERDKKEIIELLDMVLDSIKVIRERTCHIVTGDDFLLSPDNMFVLDGVCMKLIFIGESVKNIDKKTHGKLFCKYPTIPWKDVMKQRDLIAHHYFRIDADSICTTIKEDLPLLYQAVLQVKQDLSDISSSARNIPE